MYRIYFKVVDIMYIKNNNGKILTETIIIYRDKKKNKNYKQTITVIQSLN